MRTRRHPALLQSHYDCFEISSKLGDTFLSALPRFFVPVLVCTAHAPASAVFLAVIVDDWLHALGFSLPAVLSMTVDNQRLAESSKVSVVEL